LGGVGIMIATLITPMWVMQPFEPQTPGALAVAWWVLRFGPWLVVAAGLIAITAVIRSWPGGWWRRSGAMAMLLVVVGAGALSRVNVVEVMFAPMVAPRFAGASASALPGAAIVMAVRVGEQARGYPVEVMAY